MEELDKLQIKKTFSRLGREAEKASSNWNWKVYPLLTGPIFQDLSIQPFDMQRTELSKLIELKGKESLRKTTI